MLTLAIIKPDAVAARHTGKIIAHLEAEGFQIRDAQMVQLTQTRAESFYDVHRVRAGAGAGAGAGRRGYAPAKSHRRHRSGAGRAGDDSPFVCAVQGAE